jgi:hypothetical protein
MDFSEFETACGGIWRICVVIDYATKYCLAATVTRRLAARMRSAASAGPLSRPNGSSRRGRLLGQCAENPPPSLRLDTPAGQVQ